jgi:hypothetical protein
LPSENKAENEKTKYFALMKKILIILAVRNKNPAVKSQRFCFKKK